MLGVNLKQTYLPRHGVYVDHAIAGGNAAKSKVVKIGDTLLTVGAGGTEEVDVRKGTIWDVPGIIGVSKRPCILVFDGGHIVGWEKVSVCVCLGGWGFREGNR